MTKIDFTNLKNDDPVISAHEKDGLEVKIPPGYTMVVISPTETRIVVNQVSDSKECVTPTLATGVALRNVMYDQALFDVVVEQYEIAMAERLRAMPQEFLDNAPPEIKAQLEALKSKSH